MHPPRAERERDQQRDLGHDRNEPHPPGQPGERPVPGAADKREHYLRDDDEPDRGSRLPPRLDLLLAQRSQFHRHRPILALGCGRREFPWCTHATKKSTRYPVASTAARAPVTPT